MTLIACVKAEFYKQKRSFLWALHLFLPFGLVCLFLGYMFLTQKDKASYVEFYLGIIGFGFPFMIGLICGLLMKQEKEAGNFYVLLCIAPKRSYTYMSKLILLFLMEAISVWIAVIPLYIAFPQILLSHWLVVCATFFVANMFLYLQHMMISFRYGLGISAFVGIAESLISALFLTGLGDGIWYFIPCSWSARSVIYVFRIFEQPLAKEAMQMELKKQIGIGSVLVVLFAIVSFIWYDNWQGNQSVE